MTLPNMAHLRRGAPRIATPLAPELKPTPALARGGRPPAPTLPHALEARIAPAPPASAAPNPLAEEKSAGKGPVEPPAGAVTPVTAPPDTHDTTLPVPPATRVAQQAAFAAAALTRGGKDLGGGPITAETVVPKGVTLASGPPVLSPSEVVRVHRLPPGPRTDPRLVLVHGPDSPASASFRVLRHRLSQPGGPKVILVTSPVAGEGKTTCAVNLALALGEAGRARVLLLELNLRAPALARLMGFRPPVCVSEQIEFHRVQPIQPWNVVEWLTPSLNVAAAAPDGPKRPLLDGPAIALCVEQLRGAEYDYIVIDGPPVLGSADVNLIEASVDGVLLAVRARQSHARALRKSIDQIGKEKVLGVVLVGT